MGIGGNALGGATADFIDNTVTIADSFINVLATTIGNNGGTNQAVGWEAVSGSYDLLFDTFIVTALAGSGNPSVAIAKIPNAAVVNDATTIYIVTSN